MDNEEKEQLIEEIRMVVNNDYTMNFYPDDQLKELHEATFIRTKEALKKVKRILNTFMEDEKNE